MGQVDRQTYLDQRLQEFLAMEGSDDVEDWMEWLDQTLQNPWDINQVTADQLRSVPLVSDSQIQAFLRHREAIGTFQNILELQSIEGWDEYTWQKMSPLLTINPTQTTLMPWWKRGTEKYIIQRWDRSFPKVRGISTGNYQGNAYRFQQRIRWQRPQDFSVGAVLEKDPGETSYADYFGFHLAKQQKKGWIQRVVGDYQVQFGQGLVWGAGHFVGKGGETIYAVRRGQGGIRPYTSISERQAMRGVAGTFQHRNFTFSGMISRRKADARIEEDSVFTSLSRIGYHRTRSEISNRNSITLLTVGGDVHRTSSNWLVGMSWAWHHFSKPADPTFQLYNQFAFRGSQYWNQSVYFTYHGAGFQAFGEWANAPKGMAWILGATAIPHPKWEVAVLWRQYGRSFHSLYGQSFGEYSSPANEEGVYMGLKFLQKKGTQWTLFYDQFSHPWIRFQTFGPGSGEQMGFRYQTSRKNKSQWIFQGGWKSRVVFPSPIDTTRSFNRWQMSSQWISSPHPRWNFHSRLLANTQESRWGMGFFQDIKWTYRRGELKTRLGFFQTDGYTQRVYVFEPDVLMGASFPAFYGTGFRGVWVWKQELTPRLDLWIRLAYIRVWDRPQLGRGDELTPGPEKWTGTVQCRYSF